MAPEDTNMQQSQLCGLPETWIYIRAEIEHGAAEWKRHERARSKIIDENLRLDEFFMQWKSQGSIAWEHGRHMKSVLECYSPDKSQELCQTSRQTLRKRNEWMKNSEIFQGK